MIEAVADHRYDVRLSSEMLATHPGFAFGDAPSSVSILFLLKRHGRGRHDLCRQ